MTIVLHMTAVEFSAPTLLVPQIQPANMVRAGLRVPPSQANGTLE